MAASVLLFTYGSLQRGYPNHDRFAADLGTPLGRYRTAAPHALVVPHAAACTNPGCGLLHRMCALVAGAVGDVATADGEVYRVAADLLARLDQLEGYRADAEATSAYLRRPVDVAPVDGVSPPCPAQAYLIADEARWRALVDRGAAAAYATYDRTLADGVPKPCCRAAPGHAGPHDVISPFDPA